MRRARKPSVVWPLPISNSYRANITLYVRKLKIWRRNIWGKICKSVGKVHNSMNMLPNDVRVVRNDNTNIRMLTGTYILQENRARFNHHAVGDTCNLCLANNESREHFLVECSRLGKVNASI